MSLRLEIHNLTKVFHRNDSAGPVEVFSNFNLQIEPSSFVSLVGPSGCGKSTLLRILAGLENHYTGEVLLGGNPAARRDCRVGMVFQENALFPWRTALENIATGLEFAGVSRKESRTAAREYVHTFGLSGFESCLPKQLSGGMKQRVAIARTLITNPHLVLMDEPFGALDCQTRNALNRFLIDLWSKRQDTVLFVTHNIDEAVYLSDRILALSDHPVRILKDIKICMPRPRDRTSTEANVLRREILDLLASSYAETKSGRDRRGANVAA